MSAREERYERRVRDRATAHLMADRDRGAGEEKLEISGDHLLDLVPFSGETFGFEMAMDVATM